jgi:hypothetical protein
MTSGSWVPVRITEILSAPFRLAGRLMKRIGRAITGREKR